jgi:hypothetical protein
MKINNILYITVSIGLVLFFIVLIIRYLLFNINKPIIETLNIGEGSFDFYINAEGVPVDKQGNPVYDYKTLNKFGDLFSKNLSQYVNVNQIPDFGMDKRPTLSPLKNPNTVASLLGRNKAYVSSYDWFAGLSKDASYIFHRIDESIPDPSFNRGQDLINFRDVLDTSSQAVLKADGKISCQAYCTGENNGPINNELPIEWNGAQCKSVKGVVKNFIPTKDYPTKDFNVNCDSTWEPNKVDVSCICQKTNKGWKKSGSGMYYNDGTVSCTDFCRKGGGETGDLLPYNWYGAKCDGGVKIADGSPINCDYGWTEDANNLATVGFCKCSSTGLGWDDYSHADKPKPRPKLPDNSNIKCKKTPNNSGMCVGLEPNGVPYCYGDNNTCKWSGGDCDTDADCQQKYFPGISARYHHPDLYENPGENAKRWFTGNDGTVTCNRYCKGWRENVLWNKGGRCVNAAFNSMPARCDFVYGSNTHCECQYNSSNPDWHDDGTGGTSGTIRMYLNKPGTDRYLVSTQTREGKHVGYYPKDWFGRNRDGRQQVTWVYDIHNQKIQTEHGYNCLDVENGVAENNIHLAHYRCSDPYTNNNQRWQLGNDGKLYTLINGMCVGVPDDDANLAGFKRPDQCISWKSIIF